MVFPLLDIDILYFQELERLSQKFGENVLDATKKFEKLITDKNEIDGFPATALGLAAQTAVSKVFQYLSDLCFFLFVIVLPSIIF